jgi:hypothetical protein
MVEVARIGTRMGVSVGESVNEKDEGIDNKEDLRTHGSFSCDK